MKNTLFKNLLILGVFFVLGGLIFVSCDQKSEVGETVTPKTTDMPDNTEKIVTEEVTELKVKDDKTILLFIIDEGQLNMELMGYYKNNDDLQSALENIKLALEPFKEKYTPAVLIYPTYQYNINGYGEDATKPLNRISPKLHYVFEFFDKAEIPVYLEMHSSGIRTQYAMVSFAPLHYGDAEVKQSLPMDMETMKALKEKYGDTFRGIRFHELIGSNDIGLRDRENGNEKDSHAWVVQEEVIKGIIDSVDECGLELVWSDHSWNIIFRNDGKVKKDYAYWMEWLDYAVDKLGSENLTLNWANNGWPVIQYIDGEFMLKNYRDTIYGESIQSWFWQEAECSTLQWINPNYGGKEFKWYLYPEIDMPIEFFAAFCLRALDNGAKMLQFEPTFYLFNFHSSRFNPLIDYPGNYEIAPDYSARVGLKRLTDILLDPENPNNPDSDLTKWYGTDSGIESANKETKPPKRYYQTMFGVYGGNSENRYFDRYISRPNDWLEQNENRFNDAIYEGEILDISRANMTFSGIDEFFVVKRGEEGVFGEFYTHWSGKMLTDKQVFADNEIGSFVAAIPLNIFEQYVTSLEGSADDMIVLRRNEQNEIILKVYRTLTSGDVAKHKFWLSEIKEDEEKTILSEMLGSDKIDSEGFVAAVPLRTRNAVNLKAIRPKDAGVLLIHQQEKGIILSGMFDGKKISQTMDLSGKIIDASSGDINFDGKDEVAVIYSNEGKAYISFYEINDGLLTETDKTIELGEKIPEHISSLRWCLNTQTGD